MGVDRVRPTDSQIQRGQLVVPQAFYRRFSAELPWREGFAVMLLGKRFDNCRIDFDRRIRLPLRDEILSGQVLRLQIRAGVLFVEISN